MRSLRHLKKISILGSTGSIGQSTLSVVEKFPERFTVVALAAGNNVELLEKQVRQFRPSIVSGRERAFRRGPEEAVQ